jgi:NTE family protein
VTTTTPPNTIGISYSGGGTLLPIELGIARAFVQSGIKPAVISGASAGAIAATAHALDMYGGAGIDAAVDELGYVSNASLKLDPGDFVFRIIREGVHTKAIGDNAALADIVTRIVQRLGLSNITLGSFGQPLTAGGNPSPGLQIVATNLVSEEAFWFGPQATLPDALIASSAIPALFPSRKYSTPTGDVFLVDGGVVDNQPLTKLKDGGCDKIYACAVGGTPLPNEPDNLIDNLMRSVNLTIHECSKLEEQYLRIQMPNGQVIHIHPPVTTPLPDFNFTPQLVKQAVDEACQLTLTWLAGNPTQ